MAPFDVTLTVHTKFGTSIVHRVREDSITLRRGILRAESADVRFTTLHTFRQVSGYSTDIVR